MRLEGHMALSPSKATSLNVMSSSVSVVYMFEAGATVSLTQADHVSLPLADGCVFSVSAVPEEKGENRLRVDSVRVSGEGTDSAGEPSVGTASILLLDSGPVASQAFRSYASISR
jgi:hypothetical protein